MIIFFYQQTSKKKEIVNSALDCLCRYLLSSNFGLGEQVIKLLFHLT